MDTLNPAGGSKLETAVNYAQNHHDKLMNYLRDGRCDISNNRAERKAKVYATGRKNFLFHDTEDIAKASAIVLSLIDTAKSNGLNVYQYLYTLLLYMPDYKNEPAGIEQLLPWSDFIKEHCSGLADTENITPENKPDLLSGKKKPQPRGLIKVHVRLLIAYSPKDFATAKKSPQKYKPAKSKAGRFIDTIDTLFRRHHEVYIVLQPFQLLRT